MRLQPMTPCAPTTVATLPWLPPDTSREAQIGCGDAPALQGQDLLETGALRIAWRETDNDRRAARINWLAIGGVSRSSFPEGAATRKFQIRRYDNVDEES